MFGEGWDLVSNRSSGGFLDPCAKSPKACFGIPAVSGSSRWWLFREVLWWLLPVTAAAAAAATAAWAAALMVSLIALVSSESSSFFSPAVLVADSMAVRREGCRSSCEKTVSNRVLTVKVPSSTAAATTVQLAEERLLVLLLFFLLGWRGS